MLRAPFVRAGRRAAARAFEPKARLAAGRHAQRTRLACPNRRGPGATELRSVRRILADRWPSRNGPARDQSSPRDFPKLTIGLGKLEARQPRGLGLRLGLNSFSRSLLDGRTRRAAVRAVAHRRPLWNPVDLAGPNGRGSALRATLFLEGSWDRAWTCRSTPVGRHCAPGGQGWRRQLSGRRSPRATGRRETGW